MLEIQRNEINKGERLKTYDRATSDPSLLLVCEPSQSARTVLKRESCDSYINELSFEKENNLETTLSYQISSYRGHGCHRAVLLICQRGPVPGIDILDVSGNGNHKWPTTSQRHSKIHVKRGYYTRGTNFKRHLPSLDDEQRNITSFSGSQQ